MKQAIRILFLCACLSACTVAVHGQKPIRDALVSKGHTHFLALAEVAEITEPSDKAILTILAPTNKAIDEFLKSMKLTLQDMKQRPALAAAVVGYHVLPRVKGQTSAVKGFTRAAPLEAITADDVHFLRFYMGPDDKVVVEDVQNNTARIVSTGVDVGNSIIYGIDKVLLSGDVYTTLEGLLTTNPEFRPLHKLYLQAGLESEVINMRGDANTLTIFAPTAEAVKAAEGQLASLSKAQLQDVLRYHIVPAALPIPAGVKADTAYPTAFKGHSLRFRYNKVQASSSARGSSNSSLPQRQQAEARLTVEVVPEAGTFGGKAVAGFTVPKVTIANLFANRMIIHGVNQVMKPNLPNAQPPSTAKPAQGQSGAGATGRKLQQFRSGAGPSSVSTGLTSTQSSIRAAVAGNRDIGEVASGGSRTASSAAHRCWNCIVDDWGKH